MVVFVVAFFLVSSRPTLNVASASHIKNTVPVKVQKASAVTPIPAVAAIATPVAPATPAPQPVPALQINLNDHQQLMSLAGISQNDWPAADYIVAHESSWNPDATEPTTGAHGLPQALPYSKTGCDWSDALCQLKWANSYAVARYGGWWSAYDYWVAHGNW